MSPAPAPQPSILVIDDEQGILDTLRILLKNEGFDVATAQGGKAGLEALKAAAPDIVLTDIRMPQVSGIDILAAVKEQDPETPVVLMTAQASLQSAIQAVNQGAFHYVQKPFSNDEIIALCRRAAEVRRLKSENKQLKQEIRRRERSGLIEPIGKSRLFQEVLTLAKQVAPTESTVLIQGESGTGKEVIARYIHELSARSEGLFLSINCGALPESLLESELFGHVKGSFTGAVRDKQGLFAAARGGTFFLDEIGEMAPATQVKLLRVLQERECIPVGGTEAIPVDVRLVAATNRDLEDDIKRGRFRTDLYYRLNVIAIHLPPLRDRRDDIPIFVDAFLKRIAKEHDDTIKRLAQDAIEAIMAYDWPGNVRELENALERAVVLTKSDAIPLSAIPAKVTERKAEPLVAERAHVNPTLDVIERAYIQWVLQAEGGNKTRAAEVLGIDPSTLYRKLSVHPVPQAQQIRERCPRLSAARRRLSPRTRSARRPWNGSLPPRATTGGCSIGCGAGWARTCWRSAPASATSRISSSTASASSSPTPNPTTSRACGRNTPAVRTSRSPVCTCRPWTARSPTSGSTPSSASMCSSTSRTTGARSR